MVTGSSSPSSPSIDRSASSPPTNSAVGSDIVQRSVASPRPAFTTVSDPGVIAFPLLPPSSRHFSIVTRRSWPAFHLGSTRAGFEPKRAGAQRTAGGLFASWPLPSSSSPPQAPRASAASATTPHRLANGPALEELQQDEDVDHEEDREEDRPAV